MHFAIDVREACHQSRTGKGQWTYGFITALLKRSLPVTLFSDSPLPPAWILPHVSHVLFPPGILWHVRVARLMRQTMEHSLYISPTSFIVPFLLRSRVRTVVVIHDLIALRSDPHQLRATVIERLLLRTVLRNAYRICTVSRSTAHDLLQRFPQTDASRIHSIFAGFRERNNATKRNPESFILSVGTLCPRKNQLSLIRAYASLPGEVRLRHALVLAGGRGWKDAPIIRAARRTTGVLWKGYVTDDEYDRLLSTCLFFAHPSHDEGFGMQVLDALTMGVPVLTSERGSLREVAGEAALYTDPDDVHAIAQGLEILLRDADLRTRLSEEGPRRAAGFSWDRTVDLFLAAVHP
ncbi:MAG: glycosyltransferase family 1 protein [Candidatus Peregrinibacteria bacterium]